MAARVPCVRAGEFKMPVATEPYDQFKVGKVFIKNGASLPVAEVNELATKAMMKRIARGEVSLPDSAKLHRE